MAAPILMGSWDSLETSMPTMRCFLAPPSMRNCGSQFLAISMIFRQILVDFQSISIDLASFSISFSQLQSILISFYLSGTSAIPPPPYRAIAIPYRSWFSRYSTLSRYHPYRPLSHLACMQNRIGGGYHTSSCPLKGIAL